ncbi:MAG TPA: hypothetical protein VK927_01275 [Adhaeribacter sp.]|nr:hypothetical protein [Adhaeribacter sp.]
MRLLFNLKTIAFVALLLVSFEAPAQQRQPNDEKLAQEYFLKGDYAKAEALYSTLINDNSRFTQVYPNYLKTLLALKEYRDAEKLVKKAQRKYPDQAGFEVDLGVVYTAAGNKANAEKHFEKMIAQLTPARVRTVAAAFAQAELPQYVEKTYLKGRSLETNDLAYINELMQFCTSRGQNDKLLGEVLLLVQANPGQVSYAQNMLQNSLKDEKEFELMERTLISAVQKNW